MRTSMCSGATPGRATVDLHIGPISHDVDGRFPARLRLDGPAEAEELPLQALSLLQHFAGFCPHPRWLGYGLP